MHSHFIDSCKLLHTIQFCPCQTSNLQMRLLIRPFSRRFLTTPFPSSSLVCGCSVRAMTTDSHTNGSAPKSKTNTGKKEVKILMIHGFTQSGPLFHAKTRALEKLLTKTLSPTSILPILIYPTAPNRLLPRDIPGYQPDPEKDEEETDAWAWWRKDDASGEYRNFSEGLERIAECVRKAGGVDGVVGFSQGGAAAGAVAAALEGSRIVPECAQWAHILREANNGKPLKFAVSYSGFYCQPNSLAWLYEPKLTTPTLHVIGSLDTVVEESRTRDLVDRCEDPTVLVHPGGHYVPVSKEWIMPLAGFIKHHAEEKLRAEL